MNRKQQYAEAKRLTRNRIPSEPPSGYMYGWFSPTAMEKVGYQIYRNDRDERVMTTALSYSFPFPSYKWKDRQFMGLIRSDSFESAQPGYWARELLQLTASHPRFGT